MKHDARFLKNIDNPDKWWEMELSGGKVIHVRVINYMLLSNGTPLTIYVQNKSRMSYEIPWPAIQTIKVHHKL